jgi:hypothetical protein
MTETFNPGGELISKPMFEKGSGNWWLPHYRLLFGDRIKHNNHTRTAYLFYLCAIFRFFEIIIMQLQQCAGGARNSCNETAASLIP